MSLEQAILDRLEQRNGQIAQLQSTVHALERAADSEREHARQQLVPLVEENKTMAAQIESAWIDREQMQHQISELRTERDRILEISKTLVPKSALKQAVQEAAELRAEVVKLRAEVPLESTREGLKNAVAKLQEVNAQLDSAKGEAEEWLKQCNAARRQRDEVRDLCAELQSKYESLLAKTTDLGSYAMTLGRKEGEPLEMFMERQALRLAALESEAGPTHSSIDWQVVARNLEQTVAGLNAKVAELQGELDKQKTQADSMERQVGGLTRMWLKLEFERDKLKAKLEPLEKLYEVVKKYVDLGAVIDNWADIYDAVAETAKALSQLTA